MLTINRRLALQLRSVLRRALGSRGPFPNICFTVAQGMLTVRASGSDIAVEYHGPYEHQGEEQLWLPPELLNDCAGKNDDPVEIELVGKDRVSAHWRDGSVPQIVQYDTQPPASAGNFPISRKTSPKTHRGCWRRYPARTQVHFNRLFAVIREYLDALDAGRFNYRPGFGCAMCDFSSTHCRNWAG